MAKELIVPTRPVAGFFSFTSCQGCQFTILFLDDFAELLDRFDIKHFHLLKEKNRETLFDIVFVEGAVTTLAEEKKLKSIRAKSKTLIALGACACHGGIPAMRNFLENDELERYVYNQKMLDDSIEAQPLDNFVKVDYHMYGCPIIKEEFRRVVERYLAGQDLDEPEGSVCNECPRRGKDCYLKDKKECLGAMTHAGCGAICIKENIPCMMCRGPLDTANISAEIKLFKSWGIEEKDVIARITQFTGIPREAKMDVGSVKKSEN